MPNIFHPLCLVFSAHRQRKSGRYSYQFCQSMYFPLQDGDVGSRSFRMQFGKLFSPVVSSLQQPSFLKVTLQWSWMQDKEVFVRGIFLKRNEILVLLTGYYGTVTRIENSSVSNQFTFIQAQAKRRTFKRRTKLKIWVDLNYSVSQDRLFGQTSNLGRVGPIRPNSNFFKKNIYIIIQIFNLLVQFAACEDRRLSGR